MSFARRLPVYVLHDGSEYAVRGLSRLVDSLRCDPQALEMVWLSFISLAGAAKLTVPLTDICAIGNAGVVESEVGAPDLDGGLSIFESDAHEKLRKTTATTKGDWRPYLVLFLSTNPLGELKIGLDAIGARRCGYRLAFVGAAVSSLARARLTDSGFELFDVTDGLVKPSPEWTTSLPWDKLLCMTFTKPYDWRAVPAPLGTLPPPPVIL